MTYKNGPHSNIVGTGALGQALRPLIPSDLPVVFFCVKAFDLATALSEQSTRWPQDVPFVTLSNGFIAGEIEKVRSTLGARPLRWGMTTIGAAFQNDGSLKVFREGSVTAWGPYFHGGDSVANRDSTSAEREVIAANHDWYWHDDIVPVIRRKWIFNTALNTLCGVLRLSNNGKILNHRTLANVLFNEAYELAGMLWPSRASDLDPIEDLRTQFWELVHKTSENENSMARDVKLGRRTESCFLAGMAQDYRGFDNLKTYHAVLARLNQRQ